MRTPFPEVILQMCDEDFLRSFQILRCLSLHCLSALFVRVHCETIQVKYWLQLCELNTVDHTD